MSLETALSKLESNASFSLTILVDLSIDTMSVSLTLAALAEPMNRSKTKNIDKITNEYFLDFIYIHSFNKKRPFYNIMGIFSSSLIIKCFSLSISIISVCKTKQFYNY